MFFIIKHLSQVRGHWALLGPAPPYSCSIWEGSVWTLLGHPWCLELSSSWRVYVIFEQFWL